MDELNRNNPGKIEKSILSQNKIPGCDQLTRPEEIKALSKYLGQIKKVQDEHTTLQKNNLELPGRTTGRIPKVELPNFVDPLRKSTNKNKAELYDESSRIPLERDHKLDKLNDSAIGLKDKRELKLDNSKEELEDLRETNLKKYREPLEKEPKDAEIENSKYVLKDSRNTNLSNKRESLEGVKDTSLSEHREILSDERTTKLGEYKEQLKDQRETNLSNHRESLEDLRETRLWTHKEQLSGIEDPILSKTRESLNNVEELDSLGGVKENLDYGDNLGGVDSLGNTKEPLNFGDNIETEALGSTREKLNFGKNLEVEALGNTKEKLDFGDNIKVDSLGNTKERLDFGNNIEVESLGNTKEQLNYGDNLGGVDSLGNTKEPLTGISDINLGNYQEPLDFGNNLGEVKSLEDYRENLTDPRETELEDYRDPLNYGENLSPVEEIEDYQEPLNYGSNLDPVSEVEDYKEPLNFGDNLEGVDSVEDYKDPLNYGSNLEPISELGNVRIPIGEGAPNDQELEDFIDKITDSRETELEDYKDPLNYGENLSPVNEVEDHKESLNFGNNLEGVDSVEDHREELNFGENLEEVESLEDFIDSLEDNRDTTLEDFVDKITDPRNTELPDNKEELPETSQDSPRQEGDYNYFTPSNGGLYEESIELSPHIDGKRDDNAQNYLDLNSLSTEQGLYTESIQRPDSDPNVIDYLNTEILEEDSDISPYTEKIRRPDAAQNSPRQEGDYNYIEVFTSKLARDIIGSISDLTGDEMYNKAMEFMKETEVADWEKKIQSLVSSYLSSSKITPDKALEFEMKVGKEIQVFQKTVDWEVGEDGDNDTDWNKNAFENTFGSSKKQKNPVNRTGTEDLPPYKLPSFSLDSLNTSNYLRYITEKTVGKINNPGIRETLIQETLAGLVWARDKLEKLSKSNRDRLPGDDGGLVGDLVSGGVSGALDNLGNRLGGAVKSILGRSDSVNMNNPVNRPEEEDNEYKTTGWTETGKRISQSQVEYSATEYSTWKVHEAIVGESSSSKSNSILGALKNVVLGGNSNGSDNYNFSKNYLKGAGIKTTLEDLAGESPKDNMSVGDFFDFLKSSPYITTPYQFGSMGGIYGTYKVQTLDSDAYWEVILEPYVGPENGNISYLPGLHEINLRNIAQHGVNTGYNKWIPYIGFDLQKSKLTNKTLQLYDGEISYPVSMEFLNEFRLTIADDQYKSWRTYFEQCAKAAVYNSEGHSADFYEKGEELTAIDTNNVVVAMYKNITFRCRVYVMTPQYSTIHKYDLLLVMKDFSEEHTGSIDGGASDLTISFSIVGENPSGGLKIDNRLYGMGTANDSKGNSLLDKIGNAAGSIVEHGVDTVIGLIKKNKRRVYYVS